MYGSHLEMGIMAINQCGLLVANHNFGAAVAEGYDINAGAKLQAYAVGSRIAIYGTSVNAKDADRQSLCVGNCQD